QTGISLAGPLLLHARWDQDAVLRGDGQILFAGGRSEPGDPPPPLELFDPVEARGSDVGLASGHAVGLQTGAILVAGGTGVTPSMQAGLWLGTDDEVTLAPLPSAVTGQTLTRLDDGRVLLAGGDDNYNHNFGPLVIADESAMNLLGTFD